MTIQELNAKATSVQAERHTSSGLFLIRSVSSSKVLNSAMSYEWAQSSMIDWIDFETRVAVA